MRILVAGGSGLLGSSLVPLLQTRGHDVVVLDLRAPAGGASWIRCDLADDDPAAIVAARRPDIVVLLAARVDPPTKAERVVMRRLHVDGTRRLVRAAASAGARKVVMASSATVYGAWPDNPVPIDEERPVRPHPGFPYAVDKAAAEQVLRDEAGDMQWVAVRPAIIYARRAKSYLTQLLRLAPGVFPALDGCRPPMQFAHVDDVAAAFAALCEGDAAGAFNVGPAPISFDEVARLAKKRVVDVPRRFAAPLCDLVAPWMPPSMRAPGYVLDHLMHPFVVDGAKLARVAGVVPARSSAEALVEMLGG